MFTHVKNQPLGKICKSVWVIVLFQDSTETKVNKIHCLRYHKTAFHSWPGWTGKLWLFTLSLISRRNLVDIFGGEVVQEKAKRNLGHNFCNKREVGKKYFQLNRERICGFWDKFHLWLCHLILCFPVFAHIWLLFVLLGMGALNVTMFNLSKCTLFSVQFHVWSVELWFLNWSWLKLKMLERMLD